MFTSGKVRARRAMAFAKRLVINRLREGTPFERRLYFSLVSGGFRRERRAVAAGQAAHAAALSEDGRRFVVRRNTHMLEKGLVMRPRRGTFATAYIEETVQAFTECIAAPSGPLSDGERDWVAEVLEQYTDATVDSKDPAVRRAHEAIAQLDLARRTVQPGVAGPQSVVTDDPPVGWEELLALAERRKSVRWFTDRPVDREIVDRAVAIGAEAPSACNRQPFYFRIFDDPELVRQVAAVPGGTKGYAHSISHIMVIVGDLSAFFDERDRHLIYIDGCLAAMGVILGLEAQGVSTCCINWPDVASTEAKMKRLLKLGDHERPVMLVAYGYADPEGQAPFSARRGLDALRRYN